MRETELRPQFVLIIGGAGSGKNYFIEHNPKLSQYQLIDVDAIKGHLGVTAAISAIKPMLQTAFARGDNVVHPTTASNLQAQKNKIAFAREHGYAVSVLLVDTPTEVAVGRVRQRVRQGGHDVDINKIVSSNAKARESYAQLSPLADHSAIVK